MYKCWSTNDTTNVSNWCSIIICTSEMLYACPIPCWIFKNSLYIGANLYTWAIVCNFISCLLVLNKVFNLVWNEDICKLSFSVIGICYTSSNDHLAVWERFSECCYKLITTPTPLSRSHNSSSVICKPPNYWANPWINDGAFSNFTMIISSWWFQPLECCPVSIHIASMKNNSHFACKHLYCFHRTLVSLLNMQRDRVHLLHLVFGQNKLRFRVIFCRNKNELHYVDCYAQQYTIDQSHQRFGSELYKIEMPLSH